MEEFVIPIVSVYLVLVLIGFIFQMLANRASDRAKKSKSAPKMMRQFADPRTTKFKLPVFLSIFAIAGVLEAWTIYVGGFDPQMVILIFPMIVLGTYMLMWSVLGRKQEQYYMFILMSGVFVSILTFYLSAWWFTEGVELIW